MPIPKHAQASPKIVFARALSFTLYEKEQYFRNAELQNQLLGLPQYLHVPIRSPSRKKTLISIYRKNYSFRISSLVLAFHSLQNIIIALMILRFYGGNYDRSLNGAKQLLQNVEVGEFASPHLGQDILSSIAFILLFGEASGVFLDLW
jgi:hypothetical protein